MSFGEKILRYQDDILRDLAELIRIPSVRSAPEPGMPFGRESARADGKRILTRWSFVTGAAMDAGQRTTRGRPLSRFTA